MKEYVNGLESATHPLNIAADLRREIARRHSDVESDVTKWRSIREMYVESGTPVFRRKIKMSCHELRESTKSRQDRPSVYWALELPLQLWLNYLDPDVFPHNFRVPLGVQSEAAIEVTQLDGCRCCQRAGLLVVSRWMASSRISPGCNGMQT